MSVTGCNVEILNPNGSKTMFFLGGGTVTSGGIAIFPLSQHADYTEFVTTAQAAGWKIIAISGEDYPDYYEMVISAHVAEYAKQGTKPILVGHSAGGMVGLFYAKDCPSDSFFDTITLFNVPLIYPYTDNLLFQRVYDGVERITANLTIIMSQNDPLMTWKLGNFTMTNAIEAVQNSNEKINVQIIDQAGYQHSPFAPTDIAWKIIGHSVV